MYQCNNPCRISEEQSASLNSGFTTFFPFLLASCVVYDSSKLIKRAVHCLNSSLKNLLVYPLVVSLIIIRFVLILFFFFYGSPVLLIFIMCIILFPQKIIVYNRVGKCGSRTMIHLMATLTKKLGYKVIGSTQNSNGEVTLREQVTAIKGTIIIYGGWGEGWVGGLLLCHNKFV